LIGKWGGINKSLRAKTSHASQLKKSIEIAEVYAQMSKEKTKIYRGQGVGLTSEKEPPGPCRLLLNKVVPKNKKLKKKRARAIPLHS